ncbi:MAG: hypothetical protein WB048_00180, partial [Pseudolabrys sp.]
PRGRYRNSERSSDGAKWKPSQASGADAAIRILTVSPSPCAFGRSVATIRKFPYFFAAVLSCP